MLGGWRGRFWGLRRLGMFREERILLPNFLHLLMCFLEGGDNYTCRQTFETGVDLMLAGRVTGVAIRSQRRRWKKTDGAWLCKGGLHTALSSRVVAAFVP